MSQMSQKTLKKHENNYLSQLDKLTQISSENSLLKIEINALRRVIAENNIRVEELKKAKTLAENCKIRLGENLKIRNDRKVRAGLVLARSKSNVVEGGKLDRGYSASLTSLAGPTGVQSNTTSGHSNYVPPVPKIMPVRHRDEEREKESNIISTKQLQKDLNTLFSKFTAQSASFYDIKIKSEKDSKILSNFEENLENFIKPEISVLRNKLENFIKDMNNLKNGHEQLKLLVEDEKKTHRNQTTENKEKLKKLELLINNNNRDQVDQETFDATKNHLKNIDQEIHKLKNYNKTLRGGHFSMILLGGGGR